jgi:hypothetical protein
MLGVLLLVLCSSLSARMKDDNHPLSPALTAVTPAYCIAEHNVGRMALSVANNATFGDGYGPSCGSNSCLDCFTYMPIASCEYPKGSNTRYLFAGTFWIGAVVGRDTLVSTGADGWSGVQEFNPDPAPLGRMIYRSTIDPARPEIYEGAVSEQDYIATYMDTCTACPGVSGMDYLDARPHRPLHIEVTQRSFAWSYSYAEDFVLFDYSIKNTGRERLNKVYMGIYVDADIHPTADPGGNGAQDDLSGFREWQPALYMPAYCPPDSDIVNLAWSADNSGKLDEPGTIPTPAVTATRIVRTPSEKLDVSFNWWVSNADPSLDYGPQKRATFRNLQTGGQGTPEGDRAKYHFLRNREFDFDQAKISTITVADSAWVTPPPDLVPRWATGLDTRYLLSFGPFDIEPGQTLPLSLAYIAGPQFHRDPNNIDNLPGNWQAYYEGLNFDSLGSNAVWAEWIYDNPGVDTDSDGYAGEFTLCNLGTDSSLAYDTIVDSSAVPWDTTIDTFWEYAIADTVWRKGDGIPDFRGASPPPAPTVRVYPTTSSIRVVWNGLRSENTRDIFSREYDFEGYRVYIARDDRRASYTVAASYDIEDYNRYTWDATLNTFQLLESPFTLDQLRAMYADGDPNWHPDQYPRSHPFVDPHDSSKVYYFAPQDYNRSILANYANANTPIRKVYPDAPKPNTLYVDSIPDSLYSEYVTEDGFFKYYEYEYTFQDLLPSVPWWINVTAFDYGSPRSGLGSLETNPTIMPIVTYPLPSVAQVAERDLKVYVFPNPYRHDAEYQASGYEGRGQIGTFAPDRLRRIHFANLPSKCTIRIYTLDGDLVREIHHDIDPADPMANHDTWDLITRNTQLVVSGLYYWSVEDDKGNTQIGKLAIIM